MKSCQLTIILMSHLMNISLTSGSLCFATFWCCEFYWVSSSYFFILFFGSLFNLAVFNAFFGQTLPFIAFPNLFYFLQFTFYWHRQKGSNRCSFLFHRCSNRNVNEHCVDVSVLCCIFYYSHKSHLRLNVLHQPYRVFLRYRTTCMLHIS